MLGRGKLKGDSVLRCNELFRPIYLEHNHFVERYGCCHGQSSRYLSSGFSKLLLTPEEYIRKLTDYSEEQKQLNYIMAFYMPSCNANIVAKIGFGMGALKRQKLGGNNQSPVVGVPYMLNVGSFWSPRFPYENPEEFITFRWFKKNFICRENPWICRND